MELFHCCAPKGPSLDADPGERVKERRAGKAQVLHVHSHRQELLQPSRLLRVSSALLFVSTGIVGGSQDANPILWLTQRTNRQGGGGKMKFDRDIFERALARLDLRPSWQLRHRLERNRLAAALYHCVFPSLIIAPTCSSDLHSTSSISRHCSARQSASLAYWSRWNMLAGHVHSMAEGGDGSTALVHLLSANPNFDSKLIESVNVCIHAFMLLCQLARAALFW